MSSSFFKFIDKLNNKSVVDINKNAFIVDTKSCFIDDVSFNKINVLDVSASTIKASNIHSTLHGNAESATRLKTAQYIGGVYFNGTTDINLPGVNLIGNKDTTGTSKNAISAKEGKFYFKNINGVEKSIKIDHDGILKFENELGDFVGFSNVDTNTIKDIFISLKAPSEPRDISVLGHNGPDIKLDVSWNYPQYSNQITDTLGNIDISGYIIELSRDPLFNTIDISKTLLEPQLNYKFTSSDGLHCTGYYIRIKAKNRGERFSEYGIYMENSQPHMVSSGNNCYEYIDKETWDKLPDYYKQDIETIVFKQTTIPTNAISGGVIPSQNFTIEISESVQSIRNDAFIGINNLNKIIIRENTSSELKIGSNAFKDCSNLESVEIHRKIQQTDDTTLTNIGWFALETPGNSIITLKFHVDISFSIEEIENIFKTQTSNGRKSDNDKALITLHNRDPIITSSLISPFLIDSDYKIELKWSVPINILTFSDETTWDSFGGSLTGVEKSWYDILRNGGDKTSVVGGLNLSNKNINSIHSDAFKGFTSISIIYLNSNQLIDIPSDLFSDLTSLTTIFLSENPLKTLPSDIFHGLTGVSHLDLRKLYSLQKIPLGIFYGLSSLRILELNNTTGFTQNYSPYTGSNLSVLKLSNPELFNLIAFSDGTTWENFGSSLSGSALEWYNILTTGGNRTSVTNTISLENKNISVIHKNAFKGFINIDTINLNNNKLTNLPADLFYGLTKLTTLKLNNNKLTILPSGIFDSLIKLTRIELTNNKLIVIPDDVFSDLIQLTSIDIRRNYNLSLPTGIFYGLNLTEISISNTKNFTIDYLTSEYVAQLKVSNPELFRLISVSYEHSLEGKGGDIGSWIGIVTNNDNTPKTSITDLNLDYLTLTSLHKNAFKGFDNLQKINLEGNKLTSIPSGIFDGLTNLIEFNLIGDESLNSLPYNIFNGLINIEKIYLSVLDSFTSLPSGIFDGLTNLKEIKLENFTSLPSGIFDGLKNLELISINSISKTSLPPGIFYGLNNILEIELSDGVWGGGSDMNDLKTSNPELFEARSEIYSFNSHKFDDCLAGPGRIGPTLSECQTRYNVLGSEWSRDTNYFTVQVQGVQEWLVPKTGWYLIETAGAKGGDITSAYGGRGGLIAGEVLLEIGTRLKIIVGQTPEWANNSGGGGGGSFVVEYDTHYPIMIAGGGSGCSRYPLRYNGLDANLGHSGGDNSTGSAKGGVYGQGGESNPGSHAEHATSYGGGGAGLLSDGQTPGTPGSTAGGGQSIATGVPWGGIQYDGSDGGFGGGGGAGSYGSGGGGGYSGGAGGEGNGKVGGGGGSFNSSTVNRTNGHIEQHHNDYGGYVEITWLRV